MENALTLEVDMELHRRMDSRLRWNDEGHGYRIEIETE